MVVIAAVITQGYFFLHTEGMLPMTSTTTTTEDHPSFISLRNPKTGTHYRELICNSVAVIAMPSSPADHLQVSDHCPRPSSVLHSLCVNSYALMLRNIN